MFAKIIVIGWTLIMLLAFCSGAAEVTTTATTALGESTQGLAIMVSMILHFFLWCTVAVPTFILSQMFQRKNATS